MALVSFTSRLQQQDMSLIRAQSEKVSAFPFGLGVSGLHELVEAVYGDMAALTGAMLAIAGRQGVALWVAQRKAMSAHGKLLSESACRFGAYGRSQQYLFVRVDKPIDVLWAVDEGVRSNAVHLIVAEVEDADFSVTRRLKLASERYGVPVILLMPHTRTCASACETRWRVSALPSALNMYDPRAPGAPRWRAVLERCRSAPHRAGETFDLEYDDETLSLRVASQLAAGPVAASAPVGTERASGAVRRTG